MDNNQTQLDPKAQLLTKAIGMQEGGGTINYNAQGASGETGAYQWMPATWQQHAQEVLGNASAPMTPENQNQVAYSVVKGMLDKGMTAAQVASAWNSGNPNAYKTGNTGTNSSGVAYNTGAYVQGVQKYAQQLWQQQQSQPSNGIIPTANAATPGQAPIQSQGPSVGGFVGNVFNSAGNVLGGLGTAIMHPIKTLQTVLSGAAGSAEDVSNALFGTQFNTPDTAVAGQIGSYLKNRYGGDSVQQVVSNIGKTLYTDPVGALLDLSTVVDGAGAAVGAIGKIADISKIADLSKASDFIAGVQGVAKSGTPEAAAMLRQPGVFSQISSALQTISHYTNPLGAIPGALKLGGAVVGRIGGDALGMTTGEGRGALAGAFNAGKAGGAAADAFRTGISSGEEGASDLVDMAHGAYQDIKDQRAAEYQGALQKITDAGNTIDAAKAAPIFDQFDNLLGKYNIEKSDDGSLDFSNSKIALDGAGGEKAITQIANEIQKYTDGTKTINPTNLDYLKQYIDERYMPGTRSSTFVTQLKDTVRGVLNKNVPGYEEMTKGWRQASEDLNQFKSSLSLGSKSSETILKKLTGSFKNNNEARATLLKEFSAKSGQDVLHTAAGVSLKSWMPVGLSKYAESLGAIINPHILLALPATSPRLVGEFLFALGKGDAKLQKIAQAFIDYKGPTVAKVATVANLSQTGANKPQVRQ